MMKTINPVNPGANPDAVGLGTVVCAARPARMRASKSLAAHLGVELGCGF